MVPFSFCGHSFIARTDGTLFWPAQRALFVADLHFEKASWFARFGQMLPPYDTLATLHRLAQTIDAVAPDSIWCLGDSFHDSDGAARLSATARDALRALTSRACWTWITGNHDPAFDDRLGGRIMEFACLGDVVLRHEAAPDETRPELSGHFHPKLHMTVRGRRVARPCFVAAQTRLILPAFGALTGGLDAAHPEIVRIVGNRAEALVALDDRLLRFPLAA